MKNHKIELHNPARRGSARFTALPLYLGMAAAVAGTPTLYLEDATLTASGNTVTVTRVPVQTSTGAIIYQDITTAYSVSNTGALSVEAGYPEIVPSSTLLIGNFKAGNYTAVINGTTHKATLGGPGIGPGGSTAWSFSSNYTPFSATWYTGPLTANPEYARLTAAKITSAAYAYGISGIGGIDGNWLAGSLIGAAQTGNTLTISSFTFESSDHPTPIDNITWTLSP